VHLAFVGQGYEAYAAAIREHELSARVHVLGFVPPTELVPFIHGADGSLIVYYARSVNYAGALPNGLFQSIAEELPILYPDLPEIGSLMRQSNVGICIDPNSPQSIVDAVQRLMTDPHAGGTAEARRKLHDRYTWISEERVFMGEVSRLLQRMPSAQKPVAV